MYIQIIMQGVEKEVLNKILVTHNHLLQLNLFITTNVWHLLSIHSLQHY